jgi:hypothetical protein
MPPSRTVAPYSPPKTIAQPRAVPRHGRHPPPFIPGTNPIESSFATVKLRTRVTKGAGPKKAALAMAYKLLDAAQQRWRRFNGHELVADVLAGVQFNDGERVTDDQDNEDQMTDEKVAA